MTITYRASATVTLPSRKRPWNSARIALNAIPLAVGIVACSSGTTAELARPAPPTSAPTSTTTPALAPSEATPAGDDQTARPPATPSAERQLTLADTIRGDISPKSVVASGHGLFIAQNMMYRHTVTVYDRSLKLVATIPDQVNLGTLGGPPGAGLVRGAPVEAAFAPDGDHAYVSNYSMYGPGYGAEGTDTCSPSSPIDRSYLYRLDTATRSFDRVVEVGQVPKYVAATPDDRYVLVSNWCGYDLSVVDTADFRELRRVQLGAYPRGIVVSPDSATAYVAVMGSTRIAVVDLATFDVSWIEGVGSGPRHLVLSTDGATLYTTLNGDGQVVKIDTAARQVVARVSTGAAPRSMTIAEDDGALYVVNYSSNTVSKVRTDDMVVVQTVDTDAQPIGITFDVHDGKAQVWVACYSGSIMVFDDV